MFFKANILMVIFLVLSALRVSGVTHVAFQAVAHCFIGGLMGACLALRPYKDAIPSRKFYLDLAITLSIVEILCFLYFRVFKSL